MEEKKRAVAKKLITPNMQEWLPVSPKMPEKPQETPEPLEAEAGSDMTGLEENPEAESGIRESDDVEVFSVERQAAPEPGSVMEEEPAIEDPVEEEPHSRVALSDNKSGLGMGWYVVHTYSGYENKVKANIEKAIENRHLENEILEVRVPLQDVMELKNGVEKTSQKKMFPGYVLLHMMRITTMHGMLSGTREVLQGLSDREANRCRSRRQSSKRLILAWTLRSSSQKAM